MKRLTFAFFLSIFYTTVLFAQSSMSDSQIMDYIVAEYAKGASKSQVIIGLMERGVTVDRARKIREKYEKQEGKKGLGARNISGFNEQTKDRMRKQNGDLRENAEKAVEFKTLNRFNRRSNHNGNYNSSDLTPYQRNVMRENDQLEIGRELDFIMPDSLELYRGELYENDKKRGKEVFGRNIFSNKKLTFESDMNIATPTDYRLGAGDVVFVDVWGALQKSFEETISPDGTINLEGFGLISVGGLTVSQANKRLKQTLGARYSSSNVKVTVGQTKTITVNVFGEVKNPGTVTLSAFSTVFHALYMVGGPNDIGTLRNVKVYRNGRLLSTVDIYDYILNGKLSGNIKLQTGDVIQVGVYENLVRIAGKVRRPMWYEMKSSESVGTLLKYSGGITGDGYNGNVTLIRKSGGQYSVYSLDEFERNSFHLKDADSVYVDSTLNRYYNMVELRGAVYRPGMYQMDGTISTVRQLIEAAGGPTEEALLNRAIMHRRKADRSLELISLDLRSLMEHTIPDLPLKNEDVIFLPSKKELLKAQYLKISGEVNYPGEYEYAENTTLEDLVLMAGGLTDAASIVKVDISRRIRDKKAQTLGTNTSQNYSLSLKDGFIINGEPGFVLQPFDEVYVRRSPGYVEQKHIDVSGEIAFEGTYTISKKGYRLSDLVNSAGGLTPNAYVKGARLERQITQDEKNKQKVLLKSIMASDSVNLNKVDLSDFYSVGINLDLALQNPGNDQWDIILREGDKLIIPEFNNTVSINGEVRYPNTVAYKDGASLDYYINQAGGFGERALKRKVLAINMNGTVTRIKKISDIQPGASILVPSKQKRKGLSFAEIISLSTVGISLSAVLATVLRK